MPMARRDYGRWLRSTLLVGIALRVSGLAHRLANEADDSHQNPSAYSAARDAGDDGCRIQSASGRRARTEHAKQLTAQSAPENADDGVADGAETGVLERCAREVASNRSANQLHDQADDVHDAS